MNYVKLNNVMNFIPKSFREIQKDDDQWLSWALQSLRTVNTHELLAKDFALLEVVDHKVKLPTGLKRISSIKMLDASCHNEANAASLAKCITFNKTIAETVDAVTTTTTTSGVSNIHYFNEACALNVQLFQVSPYYTNCFKPMRFTGTANRNYFTDSCYWTCKQNGCYTDFSITPDGCLLIDKKTGWVCIEFTCEVTNECGEFMVPKHPTQLWNGMAHYAMAQHWLGRTSEKEQNSFQMYQRHLEISRNYMREAKGIFRMQNISFQLLAAITMEDIRPLQMPAVWSYKSIDPEYRVSGSSYAR